MVRAKHTVLIVEDNEINREILADIFSSDYNVLTAENGKDGMALLLEHRNDIDVVLLDILMPIMNGYEVIQTVKQDPRLKEIPIVVTTSNQDGEEELRCLKMGAVDFITKPYTPLLVRMRIANLIHLKESTQANIQKTRFIQNMNHEIRTPMNAIMGFSDLLAEADSSLSEADRRRYARYISSNSKMLLWMVDNMLALSEVDNDMIQVRMGDISINQVCRDALLTTEFSHPQGVNVYFTSEVGEDFTIKSDDFRVKQILVNLLTNACKATSQGEIHVHCSVSDYPDQLAVSVTDTGEGIPPEKAGIIFDRFVKLDTFKPGNGIGLSITRHIAECIGGEVFLDITYTNGARFVLKLPLE